MSTSNYFKCANGKVFGFNDRVPESIEEAYEYAYAYQRAISSKPLVIFRPTVHAGPWDKTCAIVGHRLLTRVRRDLAQSRLPETRERLTEELIAIQMRFVEVGRSVPLQLVEAA